ncbi:AMP-binding protein [Nocardioides aurantiacus]|uniref:Long-chain acyl-CoA synthetase n=1 Tax=Nocardioides aurantiacus TaxID=86796 RepID=A0A3N2CPN6_9ACTN|nr:AMP-binding protein [Nocardioides aurantiacus]ROR89487.1 long-chain acyl-CoA synthetase [Nocardioides aurantiacus]
MESNVADLLTRACVEEPGKTALSEAVTGRSVTWAGLDDLVQRVVQGLADAGMVAGYRVMIAAGNSIEFVAAYLGVLRAGMVAVPVNPRSVTGELVRVLVDSGTRMVVADAATVTTVRAAVRGLGEAMAAAGQEASARPRIVTVGTTLEPGERGWDQLVSRSGRPTPVRPDPEGLAVLLYTSGTSGRPRAAMLSHRALLANVEQVAAADPPMVTGRDVVLGVLPLYHVYGLNAVLGQVVRQHARLVLVDGFDPEGSLDLIEDEAVSVVPVAPPVFSAWLAVPGLEERLGPVRLVLSGSAPLAPEVTEAFTERTTVEVHQGYGLTEAAPVVTSTLGQPLRPRSVGRPLAGIEVRLVDEAGRTPEHADAGQIELRGANLFSGYWPDGAGGPDAEGWWATGDVGYLDADGHLYLVDRVKDLVIVSGFNVYPVEVEEVVGELAEVAQVAVVGVPDAATGEAVVAYVVPSGSRLSADELRDVVRRHCADRLARFKQPTVVEVVDQLPHTATGKVQKGRLRAEARRRDPGLLR